MHQTGSSFTSSSSSSLSSFSSTYTSSSFSSSSLRVASSPAALASRTLAPAVARAPFDQAGFDPAGSLSRLQSWLDIADRYLRLPAGPRAFLLYLAALIVVSAGATLYVALAAQILQAEVQLARLERQLAAVEQQNGDILWKIARETNMNHLHTRISAMGYVPVEKREYVVVDTHPAAPTAHPALAGTLPAPVTPAAQRPPAAWQAFFALHSRPAPTPVLTSSQVRLPRAADSDPTADQWRLWWQQTLDHGATTLKQLFSR